MNDREVLWQCWGKSRSLKNYKMMHFLVHLVTTFFQFSAVSEAQSTHNISHIFHISLKCEVAMLLLPYCAICLQFE